MNPTTGKGSNNFDELRYLFLASQVELLDAPKSLDKLKYQFQSETLGVVKVDREKCDRCWNYSTFVGRSEVHALLCDRCDSIIENLIAQKQVSQTEDGSYKPIS